MMVMAMLLMLLSVGSILDADADPDAADGGDELSGMLVMLVDATIVVVTITILVISSSSPHHHHQQQHHHRDIHHQCIHAASSACNPKMNVFTGLVEDEIPHLTYRNCVHSCFGFPMPSRNPCTNLGCSVGHANDTTLEKVLGEGGCMLTHSKTASSLL